LGDLIAGRSDADAFQDALEVLEVYGFSKLLNIMAQFTRAALSSTSGPSSSAQRKIKAIHGLVVSSAPLA